METKKDIKINTGDENLGIIITSTLEANITCQHLNILHEGLIKGELKSDRYDYDNLSLLECIGAISFCEMSFSSTYNVNDFGIRILQNANEYGYINIDNLDELITKYKSSIAYKLQQK